MPIYCYRNPKTNEVLEVIQTMKEVHEYVDSDGLRWNREFSVPTMAVDADFDAFDGKAFVDATANKRGTYGDVLDRSKELSEKRKSLAGGIDPVKEQFFKDYSKARKGAKHPDELRKPIENQHVKVEWD